MTVCVRTELFGSLVNKQDSVIYPGRRLFLVEHNMITVQHQLLHSISYSTEESDTIEVFPDQICIAAYHNFSDRFEEAVIHMLTEELLGQFCLNEIRSKSNSPIGFLLSASIVDEVIEEVLGESFSKKTREHSFNRVLQHYQK
jgi:hypothetical protein